MRTVSATANHFTNFPPVAKCGEMFATGGRFRPQIDAQSFAYGRHDQFVDTSSIFRTLTYNHSMPVSSGGAVGAAAAVLSSQMRQDVQAAQSSDVSVRLNNIRSAINTAANNLKVSYSNSVAGLPKLDEEGAAGLSSNLASLADVIERHNQQLTAIKSATIPDLPKRAADAPAFGVSALGEATVRKEVALAVPRHNIRPFGNDLGGVLERDRSAPESAGAALGPLLAAEAAKLDGARAANKISPDLHLRLHQHLASLDELVKHGNPGGLAVAQRVYEDTQSERQAAEGKVLVRQQTIVHEDGSFSTQIIPADAPVSPNAIGNIVARISGQIDLGSRLSSSAVAVSNSYQGPDRDVRNEVAKLAVDFVKGAQEYFFKGQLADADTLAETGLILADVATTWIPVLGVPRSLTELATGRDLLTSEKLSDLELAGRVLDIATVGFGGKLVKGFETVRRIAQPLINTERYKKIIAAAERFSVKAMAKGIAPTIAFDRLRHIVDRHVAGGMLIDKSEKYNAVFINPDEILDLAIDAVKHPDAIVTPVRDFATKYVWKRAENTHFIGRGITATDIYTRDVVVLVREDTKEIFNIYPRLRIGE